MSMVSKKTIDEINAGRQLDFPAYKNIFEKYARFYKDDDKLEILDQLAGNPEAVKIFIETVDIKADGSFFSGVLQKMMRFRKIPPLKTQQMVVSAYETMLFRVADDKMSFIDNTLKNSVINGLIALTIRVMQDTDILDVEEVIKEYELRHTREEFEYEARDGKVFRKKGKCDGRSVREII